MSTYPNLPDAIIYYVPAEEKIGWVRCPNCGGRYHKPYLEFESDPSKGLLYESKVRCYIKQGYGRNHDYA